MLERIILTGPTASGKGEVAHELAKRLDGEVICMDSMKIYREMEVGTAKPPAARRREVAYHLLDFVDPSHEFSAGEYLKLALEAVKDIEGRGKRAIFCGGTALYLSALVDGLFQGPAADWTVRQDLIRQAEECGLRELHARLEREDPAAAAKIHPNDQRRIVRALEVRLLAGRPMSELWRGPAARLEEGSYRLAGLWWERPALYARIDERVARMARDGLWEEARSLSQRPAGLGRAASQCIGYKEILAGDRAGEAAGATMAAIQKRTRNFAKQQLTWFRRFPIRWIPAAGRTTSELAVLATLPKEAEP